MSHDNDGGITRLKVGFEDPKPDYVIMTTPEGAADGGVMAPSPPSSTENCTSFWWSLWWWGKLVFVFIFLAILGVCFFVWIGPFLMDKEVIPVLNWETNTFSKPVLAVLIFASVALFPSIFLPSTPSILAGEGDWYDQFRAVMLLRISPFPYAVYNYCAVATDVKFVPYLLGTLVGMVPEILVAIYTGIMIRTLADASHDHRSLTTLQIVFTVGGFVLTIATTVVVTVYAKKRLSELQKDEEQLLLLQ
ncbi:hypothetical protein Ccrd_006063 [Cynara cardunculus var. scolymus]|uniref:VTT domain-containing protein n=1 Tax=Cynara cardunculus var. scolymus TaxID=59895 RepID=A0A124SBW6_CYNCS|nr:hypothetical protein Ccrd_006063 [Cynara cardunculus var. scolymus]